MTIYQVDAFTDHVFGGNPAAVCPLKLWPSDTWMQAVAAENNLAETAFYVPKEDHYEIRWFTPSTEVDLCGHATLAAAYVLFNFEHHEGSEISFFSSRSGLLPVQKKGAFLTLDFPVDSYQPIVLSEQLLACFDKQPTKAYKGKTDIMLIFEKEDDIREIQPRLNNIAQLAARGVIVTAKGDQYDFVSRFFAPQVGVDEDPVTGSAHTTLVPYWANMLGKNTLSALQLSKRKGLLNCLYLKDRIQISGQAKLYLKGELFTD